jgi:multicomponent Na+:H+ antiporter subunit D
LIASLPVLLFLVPFLAALIAATGGWFVRGWARGVATAASLIEMGLVVFLAQNIEALPIRTFLGGWAPPHGIEWSLDPLGALIAALIAVTCGLVLIGGHGLVRAELAGRETSFYTSALLLQSGLLGIVLTADLFNLFVHLEVASLSAYALVAAGGKDAPRAAVRYLIVGTLGASVYLLGVGLLYASTGSLNMADVAARLAQTSGALPATGAAMIAVGLALKMGLFPLHAWMPAAYAQAPAAGAAILAPLSTKVAAFALLRIAVSVLVPSGIAKASGLLDALALVGSAAMVAGSALAFLENDLRRMLAYSSVSQIGIVVAGVGLHHPTALLGSTIHIGADVLAKAALFLIAGALAADYGIRDVRELRRLRRRAPLLRASILVVGLSLIGIPPLMGFFGKWYLLSAAVDRSAIGMVVAIALSTVLTIAYVFRLIEGLYFTSAESAPRAPFFGPAATGAIFAAGLLLFSLISGPVLHFLAARALPGGS